MVSAHATPITIQSVRAARCGTWENRADLDCWSTNWTRRSYRKPRADLDRRYANFNALVQVGLGAVGCLGWAVWGGLLVATLIPATLKYVRILREQIIAVRESKHASLVFDTFDIDLGSQYNSPLDRRYGSALSKAFLNLCVTSVSICALVSIYTGVAVWSAVDAVGMLHSPSLVRASYLIALYPYVGFVGTAATLLLIRSFKVSENGNRIVFPLQSRRARSHSHTSFSGSVSHGDRKSGLQGGSPFSTPN